MNKWSTSLPSSNHVQYNTDPMFMHQTITSSSTKSNQNLDDDNESLTDVSIITRTKQSSVHSNQTPRYCDISVEQKTDDQLFQSLVAYADTFNSDGSVYSIQDIKDQLNSSSSIEQIPSKRRTQSSTSHVTSLIENQRLTRHKSCDNITGASKPATVAQQDLTKFIPSYFFSVRKRDEEDNNEKHSDESTTITNGSKFEWGYLSDTMDDSNKLSKGSLNTYEATTDINELNLHYLQDLERFSKKGFSQNTSSLPITTHKKNKDLLIQQQIDTPLLQKPTLFPKSAPIIIREILNKPPSSTPSIQKHFPASSTNFVERNRSCKPTIAEKCRIIYKRAAPLQHKRHTNEQPKQIIIEYDQVNVTVDQNIKQRKEIKRVNPNQYIKQYGYSLYSNEHFHKLLKNIIS